MFCHRDEYGMDMQANELSLRCDCPETTHSFVRVPCDVRRKKRFRNSSKQLGCYIGHDGSLARVKNVFYTHEDDPGLLWKHTDFRRLIIRMICAVVSYEYCRLLLLLLGREHRVRNSSH